jgi:hypothetical protein
MSEREAAEQLAFVLSGIVVLRNMLRNRCLHLGTEKADEMVRTTRELLAQRAPYPEFCGQPERCVLAGRCTREIVCND